MRGNAPHKEPRYSPTAVGADDDQVNSQSLRRFNDCVIRKSLEQHLMRFDPFFAGLLNERADVFFRLRPAVQFPFAVALRRHEAKCVWHGAGMSYQKLGSVLLGQL